MDPSFRLQLSPPDRREEAALRLMLERREAELREAMKLRHSLTTLLHALRVDMEQVSEGTSGQHPWVSPEKEMLVNTSSISRYT